MIVWFLELRVWSFTLPPGESVVEEGLFGIVVAEVGAESVQEIRVGGVEGGGVGLGGDGVGSVQGDDGAVFADGFAGAGVAAVE